MRSALGATHFTRSAPRWHASDISQCPKSEVSLANYCTCVFTRSGTTWSEEAYDWLVVNQNGHNAQYKGIGVINGAGEYKFMIWATDDDTDTFRIKIFYDDGGTEVVVYDNGFNQAIGGGNIKVHAR